MPFVKAEATEKLTPPAELGFGADEWVEVRSVYTAAIRQRVMARAMKIRIENQQAVGDNIDIFTLRQATLEEVVVAWSDTSPVTPEALAAMPAETQDWLIGEFDRIAGGRSEAEKKDSGDDSSPA